MAQGEEWRAEVRRVQAEQARQRRRQGYRRVGNARIANVGPGMIRRFSPPFFDSGSSADAAASKFLSQRVKRGGTGAKPGEPRRMSFKAQVEVEG